MLLSKLQHASAIISNGGSAAKEAFINNLVSQMTVEDIVLQIYLMFADDVVGPRSDNALYDHALSPAPGSPIGVIHDWYPLNKTYFNDLQKLNLEKSHLKIPFLHTGECLHGVGSFQQSMFPQALGMSASFDTSLAHRVGSAIGAEARSIGIHACFSPVLDICQDPRWGRCQGQSHGKSNRHKLAS
jgi:beta-glucosidase-like glycosyl hydrolase